MSNGWLTKMSQVTTTWQPPEMTPSEQLFEQIYSWCTFVDFSRVSQGKITQFRHVFDFSKFYKVRLFNICPGAQFHDIFQIQPIPKSGRRALRSGPGLPGRNCILPCFDTLRVEFFWVNRYQSALNPDWLHFLQRGRPYQSDRLYLIGCA